MVNTLSSAGVDRTICSYLWEFLKSRELSVRYSDSMTITRTSGIGLAQGDPLSPLLFNVVTMNICHDIINVSISQYADDFVLYGSYKLLSDGCIDLQYALNMFCKLVEALGLDVSERKTKNRSHSVLELQNKLSEIGQDVGTRLLDLYFVRERNSKREIKLLNMLLFVKSTLWKTLFGKEADKLEHANDDERTYYIIEKDALVNKFISVPKDKGSLNCAVFNAGIIEAVLTKSGFPAKVTAHWHKGTTYMVKFDDVVISRDKTLDDR
ncbi:unnamed protein product [Plutella xylostella]|uniref:Trafficking protein particle complex subunit 5 n=1 Tax=Plutella xylostella TaxID=51655 RepID=A0A8S4FXZ0_PLUXY|nr:unnamed protein product [Plutella xylostella]